MIEKLYLYIFYLTVIMLNWCSTNFIIKPFILLMKLIGLSEKRLNNVRKIHLRPIDDFKDTTNISSAFKFMVLSLNIFILSIEIIIFKIPKNYSLIIAFCISTILSFYINHLIIWKSDRYKKFFITFKKDVRTKNDYILAILYHLIIIITIWVTIFDF